MSRGTLPESKFMEEGDEAFGMSNLETPLRHKEETGNRIIKFNAKNSLIILDKVSKEKIEKSIRNIPNIKITDINHFSAFDVIKFKKIVFTETSVKELEKRYA